MPSLPPPPPGVLTLIGRFRFFFFFFFFLPSRNTPFNMADTNSASVREFKTDLALYEKGRPEYSKESVEFLLSRVGVLPSDNKEPTKLLEIAAGTGKFTRAMVEVMTAKKANVEIIASDIQMAMCDKFRRFVPGIEMLQFPAENMGKIECFMLKLGHSDIPSAP